MADKINKEKRSKNMQAIRSQSKLENEISKALWHRGLRFRKNDRKLYGTPDISIKKYRIVIFIDSCFWHCCPLHGNIPSSNKEFWHKKLTRNIQRDQEVTQYYLKKKWHIIRIWEHDWKNDPDYTLNYLITYINQIKYSYKS